MSGERSWQRVCHITDLDIDRGAAAIVDDEQIALFRVSDGDAVFAIGNLDPGSGAFVLARGIVGSERDVPKVASPMYKHTFDLRTGRGLSHPELSVPTYPVRIVDGWVEVSIR
jgi:nitrite reductase (NADH) small subunit